MTNITESVTWEPTIYQIGTTDAVLGGAPVKVADEFTSGFANAPIQQLANRTQYLKQQVDTLASDVQDMKTQIQTLDLQQSDLATRMTGIEADITTIQTTLNQIDTRFETDEALIATIEADLTSLTARVAALESASGGGNSYISTLLEDGILNLGTLAPGQYSWESFESKQIVIPADDVTITDGKRELFVVGQGRNELITVVNNNTDGSFRIALNGVWIPFQNPTMLYLVPKAGCIIKIHTQKDSNETQNVFIQYSGDSVGGPAFYMMGAGDFTTEDLQIRITESGYGHVYGRMTYRGSNPLTPADGQTEIANWNGVVEVMAVNNPRGVATGFDNSTGLPYFVSCLASGQTLYITAPSTGIAVLDDIEFNFTFMIDGSAPI